MNKSDKQGCRIFLVLFLMVLIIAELCILLWNGNGAFTQGQRLLLLILSFGLLVALLWVEVR